VYCREALVNELRTPFVKASEPPDAARASVYANPQFDYTSVAHRFEGGNPNFLGVKVLHAGAEFLQSIGLENIERRVRELTTSCIAMLDRAGFATQTPRAWEERAHIVNVLVPDAAGLMERLRDKHRVVVNVKDGALRVSMSFFNNEADLEKAVSAISKEAAGRPAAAA
jgi:selenocysteine lyase/cysteine desulfurase